MKFSAFVSVASLVAGTVGKNDFIVGVANQAQCASTEIVWKNGAVAARRTGPYSLTSIHPALCSVWIERDGAGVPVVAAEDLDVTSYPFVNDAAAGYTVSVKVSDNDGDTAFTQYTILPSGA
uniref:Uncharacterized protein n=1 Tax=Ganoderma boninense TaxID=34458 RepID=A0A5K1JZ88_9APHY|nr:Uncharacterized protein [Ganoderma boninense]